MPETGPPELGAISRRERQNQCRVLDVADRRAAGPLEGGNVGSKIGPEVDDAHADGQRMDRDDQLRPQRTKVWQEAGNDRGLAAFDVDLDDVGRSHTWTRKIFSQAGHPA